MSPDDDDHDAPPASKGWPSCLNHNLGHAVAAVEGRRGREEAKELGGGEGRSGEEKEDEEGKEEKK